LNPDQPVWTPDRTELREWFHRNAGSLAELYVGAVTILYIHNPITPGWSRLVAHAVREIRNRLPDEVAGKKIATQLQYKPRLDDIADLWGRAGLHHATMIETPVTAVPPPADPGATMPRSVYERISELVRDHNEARERPVEAALRLFEAISPGNKGQRAALEPTVNEWIRLTGWFQSRAHDAGSVDEAFDVDEYKRQFEAVESILVAVIRDFFKTTNELDKILEDTNT
jgi:hypothetical protein